MFGDARSGPSWVTQGDSGWLIRFPRSGRLAFGCLTVALTTLPWASLLPRGLPEALFFAPLLLFLVGIGWGPRIVVQPSALVVLIQRGRQRLARRHIQRIEAVSGEGGWGLRLATDGEVVTIRNTGASPSQLVWVAEFLWRWRQTGEISKPDLAVSPRTARIDDLEGPIFSSAPPIRGGTIATTLGVAVLFALAFVPIREILGIRILLTVALALPLLGYEVMRRARTEVQVRRGAVNLDIRGLTRWRRQLVYDDLEDVVARRGGLELRLRDGRRWWVPIGDPEPIATAIRQQRGAYLERPERRAERDAVSDLLSRPTGTMATEAQPPPRG